MCVAGIVAVALLLGGCLRPEELRAVIETDPAPPVGSYPLEVTFDGARSRGNGIQEYIWEFDPGPDGEEPQTHQGRSVTHTFPRIGTYTARLTVVDREGNVASGEVTVRVTEPADANPPVARFSVHGIYGGAVQSGTPATFDASDSYAPDGEISRYHWDFGEGPPVSTREPSLEHTYEMRTQSEYVWVTLIVEDEHGQISEPERRRVHVLAGCPGCR